ncbi:hypothetical protein ACQ4PT_049267 [Festuca glaucescens]
MSGRKRAAVGGPGVKTVERRKRMIKNRESAARSRARKQMQWCLSLLLSATLTQGSKECYPSTVLVSKHTRCHHCAYGVPGCGHSTRCSVPRWFPVFYIGIYHVVSNFRKKMN